MASVERLIVVEGGRVTRRLRVSHGPAVLGAVALLGPEAVRGEAFDRPDEEVEVEGSFALDLDARHGMTDATVLSGEDDAEWLVAAERAVVEGLWRALGWRLTHVDSLNDERLARWPEPSRHAALTPGTAGALWKRLAHAEVQLVPSLADGALEAVARAHGVGALRRGASAPVLGPGGDVDDAVALAFAIGCGAQRGVWARDGRFMGLTPPPVEAPDWSDLSDLRRLAAALSTSNGCSTEENLENLREALAMTLPKFGGASWEALGARQRAAVSKAVAKLMRDAGL